jgi:hypothetical protein
MPQLKKVVVAYGNELIYTDTYEQALAQLAGGQLANAITKERGSGDPPTAAATNKDPETNRRMETIRQYWEKYRKATQQGQWTEAGKALEALDSELRRKP